MMVSVKSLSRNSNIVISLLVFVHYFSSFKIFLILGISDFLLYPTQLGYYYFTRLWTLFILFQQASTDAMLVGK